MELGAPPPVLCQERLGILNMDAGRYEVTCNGRVPSDVLGHIQANAGVTGGAILEHFGRPPFGTPPDVLRAVIIGLLRGAKIRVTLPDVGMVTSVRDEGVRELLKEGGLRKATFEHNSRLIITPRDIVAMCTMFKDSMNVDVARNHDAVADAVHARFAGVRERLTDVEGRFRHLPRNAAWPDVMVKLGTALEACRRNRNVEPTLIAVKKNIHPLRDGLILLRKMETDLSEATIETLRQAEDVLRHCWPGLQALGADDEARAAATAISAHLETERAWEDAADLVPRVEQVRSAYRARRKAILDAHATKVEQLLTRLKLRDGFEKLGPDQRHQVLRHLSEGALPGTDEKAVAPPIEALEAQLAGRREVAESKALAQLDAFLETPTVDLDLGLHRREIKTEGELNSVLEDIRGRVLAELGAGHRVRLK
jgi:hypothetical protein